MCILFNFFYVCFLLLHIVLYTMPTALLSYYPQKKSRSQTGNQSAAGGNRTHIAGVGVLCSIR